MTSKTQRREAAKVQAIRLRYARGRAVIAQLRFEQYRSEIAIQFNVSGNAAPVYWVDPVYADEYNRLQKIHLIAQARLKRVESE